MAAINFGISRLDNTKINMELQTKKLSSAESRKLMSTLKKINDDLTLNVLKGYFYVVATTPALISPADWLTPVLDDEMEQLLGNEWLFETLIRLYNQINQEVVEGSPKLPANCKFDNNKISNNFSADSPLHQWSDGVAWGLEVFAENWAEKWELIPDSELEQEVVSYWGYLIFFADESQAKKMLFELTGGDMPLAMFAQVMRKELPAIIKDYAKLNRAIYLNNINEADESLPSYSAVPQGDLFDQEPPSSMDNVIAFPGQNTPQQNNDLNNLIEEAEDELDIDRKVALAKKILQSNDDIVEAHHILADFAAHNEKERIAYLEQAVAAGERHLGETFISENAGYFWGIWETRPYMQALLELAEGYAGLKKDSDAIKIYQQMLVLNPNDNQGVRHVLISLYLEARLLNEVDKLLKEYEEDRSAFLLFSRVLLAYIRNGDTPQTRELRKQAVSYNKYVPKLLAGRIKMPRQQPEYYGPGDKDEAIIFTTFNQQLWRGVAGSIPWLLKG